VCVCVCLSVCVAYFCSVDLSAILYFNVAYIATLRLCAWPVIDGPCGSLAGTRDIVSRMVCMQTSELGFRSFLLIIFRYVFTTKSDNFSVQNSGRNYQ